MQTPKSSIHDAILPFAVLAFATLVLWRGFLGSSLWLDETVSVWVTAGTLSEAVERAVAYQGQSPFYYLLLWCWRAVLGSSELVLRSLSILFLVGTAASLHYMIRTHLNRQVAWWSLLLLIALDPFTSAMSARPYALALFCVALSCLALVRLMKFPGIAGIFLYGASVALVGFGHYLFLLAIIPQVLWVACQHRLLLSRQIGALLLAAGLLSPCIGQLQLLKTRSAQLSFAVTPDALHFFSLVAPGYLVLYLAMGCALGFLWCRGASWKLEAAVSKVIGLSLLGWFLVPVFLLLLSWSGGPVLILPRYILWTFPFLALLGALIVTGLHPERSKLIALIVVFSFASVREVGRQWQVEDWRGASEILHAERAGASEPVLLYSGLIESDSLDWLRESKNLSYLTVPRIAYEIPGEVIPIPSDLVGERGKYFNELVVARITHVPRIWLLYLDQPAMPSEGSEKLQQTLKELHTLGFEKQLLKPLAGQVRLIMLDRSSSS